MTVATTTFDLDAFARAYADWDVDALLALYADGVELVQIDREHPPSAPLVRRGKDMLRGMAEHCAGAGVRATVDHAVAGDRRAAFTITCEFPGGRRVVANSIVELEGGRIVREHDVVSGDPRE